jgi:hypothetical protein
MKTCRADGFGTVIGSDPALQECDVSPHGGHDPACGFQIDFSVVECGVRFGVSQDRAGGFQSEQFGQCGGGVVSELIR